MTPGTCRFLTINFETHNKYTSSTPVSSSAPSGPGLGPSHISLYNINMKHKHRSARDLKIDI